MSALSPSGPLSRAWHEVADWAVAGRDMAAALWRQFRWHMPEGEGGDKGCGQVPVVLIPGILEPWSYLAPLARWLGRHGHTVEFVEGLGWNLAHLDPSAGSLPGGPARRGVTAAASSWRIRRAA